MTNKFKVVFYLRTNYTNKEGEKAIMTRIYFGRERLCLGNTGYYTKERYWDSKVSRCVGRKPEALETNYQLDNIETDLKAVFRKLEFSDDFSLDKVRAEYLKKPEQEDFFLPFFDNAIECCRLEVGRNRSKASLQKYLVVRKRFAEFLKVKYKRTDILFNEINYVLITNFEHYLITLPNYNSNTITRMMRTLKAVTTKAQRMGLLKADPFLEFKFHFAPVDRGFLSDEEISALLGHRFGIERLEQVRDTFVFSCFTGLSYADMLLLTEDNIKIIDGQRWIIISRKKTNVTSNVPLLAIPDMIIKKYEGKLDGGKLLPIISNQKLNAYLKEIADLCGINKNLTCHLARHTFATLALNKGVSIESVSKMLGHTSVRTTQIYAKITSQKVREDMKMLASKIKDFTDSEIQMMSQSEINNGSNNKTKIVAMTHVERNGSINSIVPLPQPSHAGIEPPKKKRGRPKKNAI